KANPLAGTGTGDVKDELVKVYYQKGYTEIYNLKLNAHNQFLQSFASLGVLGFLFLIMVMLAATVNAVKTRNWLLFSFTGIVAANMMIESVLEVSAGAAFVSLFFPLLLSFNTTKIND
ncbi:MAG TPA: O-antigen ligase family protein, partial [Bacteroidia bacterium]|nr:O-antigen ligase family protein [Bacteroidia bacterium]